MTEVMRSEYVTNIRDPIWNEIGLTRTESQIINTKSFSRLRHIRQMGFAYLAFQGANHTRYEHSIGVLRAAHLMYQMIKGIPPGDNLQFIRLAALLHDIGHPPFSHAVEAVFIKYPNLLDFGGKKTFCTKTLRGILGKSLEYSHEGFTAYIIKTDPEISKIFVNNPFPFNVDDIARLATGKPDLAFSILLNGDFDVDKIDYIIRDSYYCGLSHKIDLNEFRGKIVMQQDEQDFSYKLFLTPGGVSAINSLLLARYKLIREAHDNPQNRIATQMFIEKMKLWLENMPPDERAKKILDIHTTMTDSELTNHLAQFRKGPDINAILNGKLFNEVLELPFTHMHPVVKASSYILLNNPVYIGKMQEQLRKNFNDNTLLFEISEPKPPKFTTLVQFEDAINHSKEPRNIFGRYYTAHGILIDSFNDLTAYVYSKKLNSGNKNDLVVLVKKYLNKKHSLINKPYFHKPELNTENISTILCNIIANNIIENARYIRTLKTNNNTILDIELLLLVLSAVELFGKEKLKRPGVWINTDGSLHSYLKNVVKFCKDHKLNIVSEYRWDNQEFSTKIFRDLERLINMGLVDHVHKLVPYGPEWGFRIDRRISGWGKTYVGMELNGLHQDIVDYVLNTLNRNIATLKKIIDTQQKIEKIDELNKIKDRAPLNEQLYKLRTSLRKKRDLILTV